MLIFHETSHFINRLMYIFWSNNFFIKCNKFSLAIWTTDLIVLERQSKHSFVIFIKYKTIHLLNISFQIQVGLGIIDRFDKQIFLQ